MNRLEQKVRSLRARLYSPFRPRRKFLKQVKYRGVNLVVLANEDVGWRLISRGEYEKREIECLEEHIREDDFCLDVGANVGIHSILMAKKACRGRLIAFEPISLYRHILAINVALNGLADVQVYDTALSDTEGPRQFSVSEDGAYSSIRPTKRKAESMHIEIKTTTLDSLFACNKQRIDIMKIDVEGAELLVLKGGLRLLSTLELRPRALLVELNEQNQAAYGYMPQDVVKFMDELGYQAYSITPRGTEKGFLAKLGGEDVLFRSIV